MFSLAVQSADDVQSLVEIRDYLALNNNKRHREEAHKRLADFYDQIIAELRKRAAKHNLDINQSFFDGIVAILEGLKDADQPLVTMGFKGQIDALPTSPEQKTMEESEYDVCLRETPKLRDIADRSLNKSAILSVGRAFDSTEVARREEIIFDHLKTAVQKVINKDILSFRRADSSKAPMIEVAYHIHAPGKLFLYVVDDVRYKEPPDLERLLKELTDPNRRLGRAPEKSVKGLIRHYDIEWIITVRPTNKDRTYVWQLKSEPLHQLNYRSETGDPEWAPYAVVLYSAFFDMSGRLIRNFGLTPDLPPNTFTFRYIGNQSDDLQRRLDYGR